MRQARDVIPLHFIGISGGIQVVVVLNVKVTGSAEIVVTAGSSTDNRIDITNFLGWTIGDVLQKLARRGYVLTFVTDKYFVCTKGVRAKRQMDCKTHRVTRFAKW